MGSDPDGQNPRPSNVPAAIAALVPRYVAARRRDCAELRQRIEQHDAAWIFQLGHRLKGSGRSYGFPGITQLGRELETAARDQAWPELQALVGRLDALISSLEAEPRTQTEAAPRADTDD